MISKILFRFGYVPEVKRQELVDAIRRMANEKLALQAEIASLKSIEKKEKSLVDVSLGDPIPDDSEARRMYVAQVAGFFKDVMEPKLKYMISNVHNMFEETSSERDFDLVLKGVVYSFRELIKWGEVMRNEQIANQVDDKVTEEEVKTLQDKLN